ncbi:MAG: archaellin/type IV pilin N-terminal domain-containing protein, partial [Conexivisphaera sp.]
MKEIYIEKEDAVSPVIATILMVAITVVLAATVYILVSHYTSTGATTPFAGSLAEQSSTSTSVTVVLTFTTP